jgi:hypothetical protein
MQPQLFGSVIFNPFRNEMSEEGRHAPRDRRRQVRKRFDATSDVHADFLEARAGENFRSAWFAIPRMPNVLGAVRRAERAGKEKSTRPTIARKYAPHAAGAAVTALGAGTLYHLYRMYSSSPEPPEGGAPPSVSDPDPGSADATQEQLERRKQLADAAGRREAQAQNRGLVRGAGGAVRLSEAPDASSAGVVVPLAPARLPEAGVLHSENEARSDAESREEQARHRDTQARGAREERAQTVPIPARAARGKNESGPHDDPDAGEKQKKWTMVADDGKKRTGTAHRAQPAMVRLSESAASPDSVAPNPAPAAPLPEAGVTPRSSASSIVVPVAPARSDPPGVSATRTNSGAVDWPAETEWEVTEETGRVQISVPFPDAYPLNELRRSANHGKLAALTAKWDEKTRVGVSFWMSAEISPLATQEEKEACKGKAVRLLCMAFEHLIRHGIPSNARIDAERRRADGKVMRGSSTLSEVVKKCEHKPASAAAKPDSRGHELAETGAGAGSADRGAHRALARPRVGLDERERAGAPAAPPAVSATTATPEDARPSRESTADDAKRAPSGSTVAAHTTGRAVEVSLAPDLSGSAAPGRREPAAPSRRGSRGAEPAALTVSSGTDTGAEPGAQGGPAEEVVPRVRVTRGPFRRYRVKGKGRAPSALEAESARGSGKYEQSEAVPLAGAHSALGSAPRAVESSKSALAPEGEPDSAVRALGSVGAASGTEPRADADPGASTRVGMLGRTPYESRTVASASSELYTPPDVTLHPNVTKVCCDEATQKTQFAYRMAHCEDKLHTAAASLGSVVTFVTGLQFDGSLDGVVRLSYGQEAFEETPEIIKHWKSKREEDYISDHDAVNVDVAVTLRDAKVCTFNILTHNLEGLCGGNPTYTKRADYVKSRLPTWHKEYVRAGTLMVVQELVLQFKSDLPKQMTLLDEHLKLLLSALNNGAVGNEAQFVGVTDGFTGCIIYDEKAWGLLETVETKRLEVLGTNKGQRLGKVSNAYLMKSKHADFRVWIVNVHLKAIDFGRPDYERDYAHTEELKDILDNVADANRGRFPVYLCGDYNNAGDKWQLVRSALLKRTGEDSVDVDTDAVLV